MDFILEAYKEFLQLRPMKERPVQQVPLQMESSTYIDQKILRDILSSFKTGNLHVFYYVGVHTELTIAGATPSMERFLLFYMCFLIYLFKHKAGRDIQRLSVKLVCYDGKKHLPGNNEDLTPYHVNGGITMSGGISADVVVYRKEEIVKVLTHELIHAFGLDAKFISPEDEAFVNDYFGITCKSATINESFTDALACYINTVIHTYLSYRDTFSKQFDKNFASERRHITSQACKVLVHNGYYKKNGVLMNNNKVCEKTHVTSYYVLKAVVYTDISEFLAMLTDNRLCIDVNRYISILKKNLPLFVKNLKLSNKKTFSKKSSLRMSRLDVLGPSGPMISI